jgi:thiol-disulfide isomerase/thioredoxin
MRRVLLSDSDVLVVCLCARWCGLCRDYEQVFAQVATRFPAMRFAWIDIEDDAERVDPVEVDNFPTLLIAVNRQPHFFGTLTPQPQLLERIVRERSTQADPALAARPDLRDLVARLSAEA